MVILAVHVVGNGATDSRKLRARCNRQNPATRDCYLLDVTQQDSRLTFQSTSAGIELDEVIESGGLPKYPTRVQTDIAIAESHAVGNSRAIVPRDQVDRAFGITQGNNVMREGTQTTPGGNWPHTSPVRKT